MEILSDLITWLVNTGPDLAVIVMRFSTPLALGALCGIMCERSGVVNIGIEGLMLTAAFVGFLAGAYLHPAIGDFPAALVGVVLAVFAAMLLSALHAWLSISLRTDQIISGTIINILALGGTAYFNQLLVSTTGLAGAQTFQPFHLPTAITGLPVIGFLLAAVFDQGPIVMSVVFLVVILQILLFRTRWGLRTRAVGEHPKAADTVGIDVIRTRYRNVILGGAFAGLAGAYLTLESTGSFQDGMTAGKGFIALAAMIFGRWTPIGAFGAAILFGAANAAGVAIQISPPPGQLGEFVRTIPFQFFGALPYVLTVIILAGVVGRAIPPAADGIPYDKEGARA